MSDEQTTEQSPEPQPGPPAYTLEQRRHLRRILVCFVFVVITLPIAGLGGAAAWLLVPMLIVGAFGLREAIRLRRTITRSVSQ